MGFDGICFRNNSFDLFSILFASCTIRSICLPSRTSVIRFGNCTILFVYFIVYTPLDVGLFLSLLYAILTVLLVMQVLSYLCLIYSYAIYSIITMTNTITCASVIGYITYDNQGSSSQRSCLHRFHYGRRCCLRILFS